MVLFIFHLAALVFVSLLRYGIISLAISYLDIDLAYLVWQFGIVLFASKMDFADLVWQFDIADFVLQMSLADLVWQFDLADLVWQF